MPTFRQMRFEAFGINEGLLEAISYMGFENATPIQEQAIPKILDGKDLIACAQTGTGKTAAFLLPTLHKLMGEPSEGGIRALIVVPTRELAIQIDQQIEAISYGTGISSLAVYGGGDGDDWSRQKHALTEGVDLVVATPGKLISHMGMSYADFSKTRHVILDEADRMLDIGFHEDIIKIMSKLPEQRQTLMFSATMPPKIRSLAKEVLQQPDEISIAISKPAEGVLQAAYLAHDDQKIRLIESLVADKPEYKSIIVFSSTKKRVSEIVRALRKRDISVKGISSDLDQKEREEVLSRFRSRQIRILVATDVISRGIDIKDINLVINFNVPSDAEDYVHRIGRTARADTTGVAITLINSDDMYAFSKIEELIEKEVLKLPPPEELGEGPQWRVNARRGKPKGRKSFRKGKRR